jgi:hypothetical protein
MAEPKAAKAARENAANKNDSRDANALEDKRDTKTSDKSVAEQGRLHSVASSDGDPGGEAGLQEAARKDAQDRLEARREIDPLVGGMDANTATLGWTVQQGAAPEGVTPAPGNVVLPHELPDPEAQLLAGIDPIQANAGVVVAADVDEQRRLRGVSDEDYEARLEGRRRAAKLAGFEDADVENDVRLVKDEAVRDEKAGETVRAATKRVAETNDVAPERENGEATKNAAARDAAESEGK